MELAPFLLEQGAIGGFLYHRVLEREECALEFVDTIDDPGSLQSLKRALH